MFGDRVRETTTTTGTGNATLAGAYSADYITFNSFFGTNVQCGYCIALPGGGQWEVGIGYLSASTTLVRDQVIASSNSGSAVNFSSGTKDVFCTQPGATIATRGLLAATFSGAALVR